MKFKINKSLVMGLVLVVAGAVAFSQTAMKTHGDHERGFGEHMLHFFTDYLDLTADQQTQAKAIMDKEMPTMKPLMEQMKQGHEQLNQLTFSGPFDEAKARAVASQIGQTTTEMAVLHARMQAEMIQVLTPEQKTKLQKFMSENEGGMMHKMMHGGMHDMHGAPPPDGVK